MTSSTKLVAVLKAVDIVEDPAEADEDKQEGRQEHTSEFSDMASELVMSRSVLSCILSLTWASGTIRNQS